MGNVEDIAALCIAIVSMYIAYLAYKYTKESRIENSQLKLIDKVMESDLLAKQNIILVKHQLVEIKKAGDETTYWDEQAEILEEIRLNVESYKEDITTTRYAGRQSPEKEIYDLYLDVSNIVGVLKLLKETNNRLTTL